MKIKIESVIYGQHANYDSTTNSYMGPRGWRRLHQLAKLKDGDVWLTNTGRYFFTAQAGDRVKQGASSRAYFRRPVGDLR